MSVLFVTAVSGMYEGYLPLWNWCIQRAYPGSSVYVHYVREKKAPYYAACIRFLIEPKWNGDVYITDSDMFILPEKQSIESFHRSEMKQTGLCYSNTLRHSEPRFNDRLTGLHYCNQEWYYLTGFARGKYEAQLEAGKIGNDAIDDELMLKNIVVESGLGLPEKRFPLVRRHHGIHVGTIRHYHNRPAMEAALRKRITVERAIEYQRYVEDKEFASLCRIVSAQYPEIGRELAILDSFTKRRMKG